MKKTAILSGLCTLLVLSGCSGGVTKDATYGSAADLRDAAKAVGYPCAAWSDEDTTDEFDAGTCDGLQMRVYADEETRVADMSGIILGGTLSIIKANQGIHLVVARNWVIQTPTQSADDLSDKLGGEVINPTDYELMDLLGD